MPARLKWQLRWRLSVMWALQWGITGAILTYLPLYFRKYKGLSDSELGPLMAVSAVGLWVAPFVVGQICDRWLATEKYLAIAHFVGGLTLLAIPFMTDLYADPQTRTQQNFVVLLALIGLYAAAYLPTIPLASSLTFRHLPDPDRQFGSVRIWGTVGWVMSGLALSLWLGRDAAYLWAVDAFPNWKPQLIELKSSLGWVIVPSHSDCFRIAALLSFALSSFCVFLPSTPPGRSERGAIAPLRTLQMFRDPTFSVLIAVSFLLAIVVPLYTYAMPNLLEQRQYSADWVPAVMTIGQVSEFPALLLLPLCLKRLGMKVTFAIGMAAWLVRYAIFTANAPDWLILSGIGLHGVCHVFLIIVIQLYVDSQCPPDVRASAQNLFVFLTMGIAMPIGFLLGGQLGQWCLRADGSTNYQQFFGAPAAVVLLLLVGYCLWFRVKKKGESKK